MKKILLMCAIGLSVMVFPSFTSINNTKNSNLVDADCQYGQCSKIKDNGYQCKNCSQKDSNYCWSHRN